MTGRRHHPLVSGPWAGVGLGVLTLIAAITLVALVLLAWVGLTSLDHVSRQLALVRPTLDLVRPLLLAGVIAAWRPGLQRLARAGWLGTAHARRLAAAHGRIALVALIVEIGVCQDQPLLAALIILARLAVFAAPAATAPGPSGHRSAPARPARHRTPRLEPRR
ncbi:MAG: hypothetical protein EA406_03230 [Rhodospirillales bacterium]|nr:MAG: hypothetical protein EA406_03230 [Rhodospirillales bacterium]